jgi:hypothetical protein
MADHVVGNPVAAACGREPPKPKPVIATAWPIGNARSPERNISDRIGFDAYSSYGNIERILHPVDKPF